MRTPSCGSRDCSGIREVSAETRAAPLYKRVLGAAYEQLPLEIQDMHNVKMTRIAEGRASVERGSNFVSRAIGRIFGFPARPAMCL